jgi:hypothetical protein
MEQKREGKKQPAIGGEILVIRLFLPAEEACQDGEFGEHPDGIAPRFLRKMEVEGGNSQPETRRESQAMIQFSHQTPEKEYRETTGKSGRKTKQGILLPKPTNESKDPEVTGGGMVGREFIPPSFQRRKRKVGAFGFVKPKTLLAEVHEPSERY